MIKILINTGSILLQIIISLVLPVIATFYREVSGSYIYTIFEYDYWIHEEGSNYFLFLWLLSFFAGFFFKKEFLSCE